MFVEDQQIDAFFRSQGLTFRIIEDLFERRNINRQEERSVGIRLSERLRVNLPQRGDERASGHGSEVE
jgi:hypothetical protein